ncbi:uncharacterized protein LOC122300936 [Carya illinoinensis]|uniref:uncharacterized protein LOC122300936 n=1 Tax=Carya illinoinensis TaxID=32201 RepID=UPI001C71BE1B|nr:uncharacterized protein LOC122300936 [Carya illinoinensis]
MAHSLREFTLEFVKLDRFDGTNFRRWQKKMHFLLANLKVVYVLTTPRPSVNEDETIAQSRASIKLVQDDYICKGHICNTMSDTLFDAYQNKATAKDLWNTLEAKYLLEDAPSKTFLTTKFFNYNMINSRSVVEQFNVMMHILDQFSQHNMKMDESISVSSIIDKLPQSWKKYKRSLKHRREEMSLEELGQHLRIEEEIRLRDNNEERDYLTSNMHMVEEGKTHQHKQPSESEYKNRKRE